MARLRVACQVIRYGFFIVRKSLSSFVIKGVSTPLTFYIHSRKQCDARCTPSLMVLPSEPPFRIDLQAARSYVNLLALRSAHLQLAFNT